MFGIVPITPAHGRDYKSKAAAQADLDKGMDWLTMGGQLTTKRELLEDGYAAKTISARNANLTKQWLLDMQS